MSDMDQRPMSGCLSDQELKAMNMRLIHHRDMEMLEQRFINHTGNSELWTVERSTRGLHYEFPLHVHIFYEIYLLVRGSVNILVEDEIYHLNENDLLLVPPGCMHQSLLCKDAAYERINLWIKEEALEKLDTKDVKLSGCLTKENIRSNFLIPGHTNENKLIRTAIEQLEILQIEPRFAREVSIQDFLRQIFIYAYHSCNSGMSTQTQVLHNPLVSAAIHEIGKNFSAPITLESISSALYVSKYHLAHTFKQHMGISVHQYIIDLRLAKAKQMINTRMNMGEICDACGFSNYSNFYKLFKARMGISPTQYRDLVWNNPKSEESGGD